MTSVLPYRIQGPVSVLVRNYSRLDRWPDDPERTIVPSHAALRHRHMRFTDQIEHFGVIFQRLEAVRESFRDVQRFAITRRQCDGEPLQVASRPWTEVDDHVVHCTANTTNQLCFFMR